MIYANKKLERDKSTQDNPDYINPKYKKKDESSGRTALAFFASGAVLILGILLLSPMIVTGPLYFGLILLVVKAAREVYKYIKNPN